MQLIVTSKSNLKMRMFRVGIYKKLGKKLHIDFKINWYVRDPEEFLDFPLFISLTEYQRSRPFLFKETYWLEREKYKW